MLLSETRYKWTIFRLESNIFKLEEENVKANSKLEVSLQEKNLISAQLEEANRKLTKQNEQIQIISNEVVNMKEIISALNDENFKQSETINTLESTIQRLQHINRTDPGNEKTDSQTRKECEAVSDLAMDLQLNRDETLQDPEVSKGFYFPKGDYLAYLCIYKCIILFNCYTMIQNSIHCCYRVL